MAKKCKAHYAAGGPVLSPNFAGYGMEGADAPNASGGPMGQNLLARLAHDTVDIKAAPGEYVLTPEATQMLGGPQRLDQINFAATGIPPGPVHAPVGMRFAAGGPVPYADGYGMRYAAGGVVKDEYGRWVVNPDLPDYDTSRYWHPTQEASDWASRAAPALPGNTDLAALYGTGQLSPEVQALMLANPYSGPVSGQNLSEGFHNWLAAMRSPTYGELSGKGDPVSQYFYQNPSQWGQYITRWGAPGGDKQPGGTFSYSPEEFYSALTGQPGGSRFLSEQSASAQAARHPGPNMGWMVPLGLMAGVMGGQALGWLPSGGTAAAAPMTAGESAALAGGNTAFAGPATGSVGANTAVAQAFPVAMPETIPMYELPAAGASVAGAPMGSTGATSFGISGAQDLPPLLDTSVSVAQTFPVTPPDVPVLNPSTGMWEMTPMQYPSEGLVPPRSQTGGAPANSSQLSNGAPASGTAGGSTATPADWLSKKLAGLATPDKLFDIGLQYALGQLAQAGVPDLSNPYAEDAAGALRSAADMIRQSTEKSNQFMENQQQRYESSIPQIQGQATSLASYAADPYRWAQSATSDFTRNAATRRQQLHNALLSQGYHPGGAGYTQAMRGFDQAVNEGRVDAHNKGLSTGLAQGMNAQIGASSLFPQPNYSAGVSAGSAMAGLANGYNALGINNQTNKLTEYQLGNTAARNMANILTSSKEEADKEKSVQRIPGNVGTGSIYR